MLDWVRGAFIAVCFGGLAIWVSQAWDEFVRELRAHGPFYVLAVWFLIFLGRLIFVAALLYAVTWGIANGYGYWGK